MEENDLILLNNSKKHVVRAGKSMNVFSALSITINLETLKEKMISLTYIF